MRRVAASIAARADAQTHGDRTQTLRRRAEIALHFVQHLPWRDEEGEVYQQARDTLRRGGNCHDLSVVYCALLLDLGFPGAKITWVTQQGAPLNHVLVEFPIGGRWCYAGKCHSGWCYAETTIPGAQVCEDPYDAARARDGSHPLGRAAHEIPRSVRLPPASGQDEITVSVNEPVRVLPMPMRPGGTRPVVQTAPMPVQAVTPPPVRVAAPMRHPQVWGWLNRPALRVVRAPAQFAAKPSGQLSGDPCARVWRDFAAARTAATTAVLAFPATNISLRAANGTAMPDPTGASSGIRVDSWRSLSYSDRRGLLTGAIRDWASRMGAYRYGGLAGGVLSDWLNEAIIAVDRAVEAMVAAMDATARVYRDCRAGGGVDSAAVVALSGRACSSWAYTAPEVQRTIVRGWLASRGYTLALDDRTLDAMADAVQRYCNEQESVRRTKATAPRAATVVMLRRVK